MDEQTTESVVGMVSTATSPMVTRDILATELAGLRADMLTAMYRALWIQGAGIVAVIGCIIGITEVIG